jgi:exopolysaccharide biosynthesis WecB/TagA/CpsF family protein
MVTSNRPFVNLLEDIGRIDDSDLVFKLCELAVQRKLRIFMLGGAEGVGFEAGRRLTERYPGLAIVGYECPPYRKLSETEHQALIWRIKSTKPDILFLAFSQRKGEMWLEENLNALGVPIAVNIGGVLDDIATWRGCLPPGALQQFRNAIKAFEILPDLVANPGSSSLPHAHGINDPNRVFEASTLHDKVDIGTDISLDVHRRKLSEPLLMPSEPTPIESRHTENKRAEYLNGLLATVPKDAPYDEQAPEVARLSHAFRERIAAELAPTLNAKIREMPHDTLEQKKELARWVNDELEPLGLAVQCPNTKLPARFMGIAGSYRPGVDGSFSFEVRKDGRRVKTAQSDTLPELTLTDATPQQEPDVKWEKAVKPKENRRVSHR